MSGDVPLKKGQEQELAEDDQTSSDSDQSNADLDQTTSDVEQAASQRDQDASDRDQRASDLDQEASDNAEAAGVDSPSYARTRRSRANTTLERDSTSQTRSDASRIRDATAERRDREAEARDLASAARDQLAASLDAEIEELEKARVRGTKGSGIEILLSAARDRKRASDSRQRAAAQRKAAAADRAQAREDRLLAAVDREQAAHELAAEGIDHLTKTLRRRVGITAIEREVDRTDRTKQALVVVFADVDGLKAINDSRGHAAGDRVLREVARCIADGLRPYDVVLRYGGDEFVCSLAGENLSGIRERFEAIAARVAESAEGATISVGLAERLPTESALELIARADQAMLEARSARTGRQVAGRE